MCVCPDSRGLQRLILVNGIPLSLWRHAGSRGQLQSDVGHLFPHLLSLSWCVCVCVCVRLMWLFFFKRENWETGEHRKGVQKRRRARARGDQCDRCGRWSGTTRCCCAPGQVPTCHWSVLMLTQGGGCTHLIDRKMAASPNLQVVPKTRLFPHRPPRAPFVSLSPSTIYYMFQSEYQAAPHPSCYPPVLTQPCPPCAQYIYIACASFSFYCILSGDITCIICSIIRL